MKPLYLPPSYKHKEKFRLTYRTGLFISCLFWELIVLIYLVAVPALRIWSAF